MQRLQEYAVMLMAYTCTPPAAWGSGCGSSRVSCAAVLNDRDIHRERCNYIIKYV